jgi:hypothetical protein
MDDKTTIEEILALLELLKLALKSVDSEFTALGATSGTKTVDNLRDLIEQKVRELSAAPK